MNRPARHTDAAKLLPKDRAPVPMQHWPDNAVDERHGIGEAGHRVQKRAEILLAGEIPCFDQERSLAEPAPQRGSDVTTQLRIEKNRSFGGANIRAGEIRFDDIRAGRLRPLSATAEIIRDLLGTC